MNAGATLSASGDLGGGNDVVTLSGALDTGAGSLSLGAGDDAVTLNDGAVIGGSGIDAGAATTNDALILNNAAALTFDGSTTAGFETLIKQNSGTATMTGSQSFAAGTAIDGGALDVDGALETSTVTLADGTTLNVDGSVQGAGATQAVIAGSAGANTLVVNAGGTLVAAGDLGGGGDVVTLSGTLNSGASSLLLGAGDDTLTLNDGAVISGAGIDAGAATTSDALILNNAAALTFNGGATAGFETLTKQGGGTATMTGSQSFSGGTSVDSGTLDIDGMLQTPTVALADGTTLNVDGAVQAVGATQAAITGSTGVNTVTVSAGATLLATGDLGDGNDVLDVAGTLDAASSSFLLGAGDDSLVIHDGTDIVATVDGGAGFDTRVYNINLTSDVSALTGFEGLTKTGTGVLNLNGPATSTLAEVAVLSGTLNVAAAGDVAGVQSTQFSGGATLNVDGSYAGSAGNDTFTVAGTVSGGGSITLGDGDDVLTLQDGAVLNTVIDAGGQASSDTVVLDSVSALTFDGANVAGFEELVKQNTGIATMTGAQSFSAGTTLEGGTLDVDGTLETPTVALADGTALNIDGIVQAGGATQAVVSGSTGANTVVVTAGGNLLATGDLGDGNDVLDLAGTLDTGGGTFSLGAGDDTFVVHNTTEVIGTLDAGDGNDLLNVNVDSGNLVPLGSTTGFESLGKSGLGALQINGASDFLDVQVQAGLLDVSAGGSIQAQTATVSAGATLNVDGTLQFTSGADTFTVGGNITGAGTINLLDGDDQLTLLDAADLSGLATSLEGGAGNDTLTANVATTATLGGVTGFETLTKHGAGSLHVAGPAASSFDIVLVQGGSLDVAAGGNVSGVAATTVASGATLHVDGNYAGSAGNDTFTLAGTVSGGGSITLGDGDDVLTLQDGAVLNTVIDAGGQASGDTIVLDNASALTLAASDVTGFEELVKQNSGTATLAGAHSYHGTTLEGGTLDVDGTLETPTVALADGTTLNVDGAVQAGGATQAAITGSTGVNTVTVSAGATLLATGDLGDGNDVLDVAGTLDAAGGSFLLGAGDDSLVIHDGTDIVATVDGGAGFDTRVYNINLTSDVSALTGFEGLTKTGTGVLNLNGPATSTLAEVAVLSGTLNVAAAGDVAGVQSTQISGGATLNVDGSYAGSAGNDTFTVAGTVSGGGSITLGDGDDVLTLQDGAVLNTVIDAGGQASSDTVVLDSVSALTFDGANVAGFEELVKQNTGIATMTGAQSFSAGTTLEGGTLDVDGTLETPTVALADGTALNIDGIVQAGGATQAVVSGSTGANTVVVTAGGNLLATGDLGDGNDVLDLAGTLDTGGGTFSLGAGDDTFVVHNTTEVIGTLDAGDGNDLLNVNVDSGNLVPLGSTTGFESLGKSGLGALQINGASDFLDVQVQAGLLDVSAGGSIQAQTATVSAGATLNVDGTLQFTSGADTFTVGGNITGAGTINLLDGDDQLTLLDAADLSGLATSLEGGAGNDTLTADIAAAARLGGATGFETLVKEGAGSLHIDGPAGSMFDTVLVHEGVLDVGVDAVVDPQTTAVSSGATLAIDGTYNGTSGADTFTLSGTLAGSGNIDLLDGDDILTINTGATLALSGTFDAATASADRFVLAGTDTDTFDANLIGTVFLNFDEFRKEGAGTWRLIGAAERDWTVAEGTLIGDASNFGGDIANAGTVIFDQATDGAFDGVLSGNGTTIKQSSGRLLMTAENTFMGEMQVAAGILEVDGTLPGTMTIASGAALTGTGTVGSVTTTSGAFVAPGNAAHPFGTLTIGGDYNGGATIAINAELGENPTSGRLVIHGSTSGSSPIAIIRTGGNSAQTTGDGLAIVQVDGASPADSFRLSQPVESGAYEYLLYQGGASDANDWYLRSELIDPQAPPDDPVPPVPAFRPGVVGYALGHQQNLEYGFTALGSLRARIGDQGRLPQAEAGGQGAAWMRAYTHELDVAGKRFQAQDLQMSTVHFGTDFYANGSGKASTHAGFMASVGESNATLYDTARAIAGLSLRTGEMQTDAKGAGLYWTRYGANGGYFDVSAQLLHYRNLYRDQYLATSDQSGWGGTLSAEIGSAFAVGSTGWLLEPSVQLGYQRLELDGFADAISSVASVDDDALRARAAAQLLRAPANWLGMSNASPYLALGLQHDFRDAASVTIGATALRDEIPDTTGDVSVGFTGSVSSGIELHLDLRYQKSTEGEKDGMRANFGFRMSF